MEYGWLTELASNMDWSLCWNVPRNDYHCWIVHNVAQIIQCIFINKLLFIRGCSTLTWPQIKNKTYWSNLTHRHVYACSFCQWWLSPSTGERYNYKINFSFTKHQVMSGFENFFRDLFNKLHQINNCQAQRSRVALLCRIQCSKHWDWFPEMSLLHQIMANLTKDFNLVFISSLGQKQ